MKYTNLSTRMYWFPLASGEDVELGEVFEVTSSGAAKVTTTPTGDILGVCMGGDNIEKGKVMLDIDPTSVFREKYASDAPTVGSYVLDCKLVLAVDTTAKTFDYIVKKKEAVE